MIIYLSFITAPISILKGHLEHNSFSNSLCVLKLKYRKYISSCRVKDISRLANVISSAKNINKCKNRNLLFILF